MEYYIRHARKEDLKKVVDLATEMVKRSVSPFRDVPLEKVRQFRREDMESMESAIDSPWVAIFIAEDPGGRFLGHVLVTTNNQESSTGEFQGYVFDLSVIEEMQGKGVGKNLMKVAEDFCIKGGMRYVCLNVTTANENAVGFYEGLGYKEERKRMIKVLPEKPQLQAEALPAKEKEGGR